MNIEKIDKWLDNEYGVSYTRLEELHDFVVEQDLKHREEKDKEIERLNNIINYIWQVFENGSFEDGCDCIEIYDYLKELKENNNA